MQLSDKMGVMMGEIFSLRFIRTSAVAQVPILLPCARNTDDSQGNVEMQSDVDAQSELGAQSDLDVLNNVDVQSTVDAQCDVDLRSDTNARSEEGTQSDVEPRAVRTR